MIFLRIALALMLAFCEIAAADGPTIQLKWQGSPTVGQTGAVAVEIVGVLDLDTYSLEVDYDTSALAVVDAALDAPLSRITNPLRGDKQSLLPVIKRAPGRVTIAATLTGDNQDNGALKNGVIGVIVFKILSDPSGKVALQKVRLLDSTGNDIENMTIVR